MDTRIASELLYESEATLRMVDNALDELRLGDLETRAPVRAGAATASEVGGVTLGIPSETCVRVYWQVQEALECLQQSREAIRAAETRRNPRDGEEDQKAYLAKLDQALALVDRMDSLDEPQGSRRGTLHRELRQNLLGLLNRSSRQSERAEALSTAASLVAEAEARLTQLGHLLGGSGGAS